MRIGDRQTWTDVCVSVSYWAAVAVMALVILALAAYVGWNGVRLWQTLR